jgi:hypothetical protein
MKDYSRKGYTDYQYSDWLKATPSKAIWNSILSQNVGYGEFSLSKGRKSTLSRAVALYLKQSEKKKPYNDRGFVQMEDDWEGPYGGFSPSMPPYIREFDQPWNVGEPGDNETPWTVIFDITSTSCWCKGSERPWVINGTHPIYGIGISLNEAGTFIEVDGGFGTNELFGRITGGPEEIGDVNFTAFMTTSTGISGSDNYLMPECRDCDECEFIDPLGPGSNPETIGQGDSVVLSIVDGREDFEWSVTGGGFTLEDEITSGRGNILYSDENACGVAVITIVDSCEDSIEIKVRSTHSSGWFLKSSTCVMPGGATEGDGQTLIEGGSKQYQSWGGAGGGGCGVGFGCREGGGCPERTACITFDCAVLTGDPSAYQWAIGCCTVPCPPPTGAEKCQHYTGNTLQYSEWECL